MALELDGFPVLAAIGAHRDLFADLAGEIDKTARALVVKHLKRKQIDVASLRALRGAIGAEALALVLDALTEGEIAALAAKCDRRPAEGPARAHLDALLNGRAEPGPAKAAVAKKPKAETGKAGFGYASAGRVRKPR